jgi:glycosyltransferase involved in cell wall biosynthesis
MPRKPLVLYLGNALSAQGKNPTAVEKLAPLLGEMCEILYTSKSPNKIKRAYDFVSIIFKNRKQASFVIIDTYSGPAFYFARLASFTCRIVKIPFCLALHGGDLPNFFLKNRKSVSKLFFQASFLIAPSNYLKLFFKNKGFSNLAMIPNCLEIDKFPFKKREIITKRIIWLRAFHEIYNPAMAIRVLRRLVLVDPEIHLTMVGPSFDHSFEKVRALINEFSLQENISLIGKVTFEEWVELSNDFDLFINTSNKDNLPYTILEAMALGLPVISTNAGGLPFFLTHGENSLLCDCNADEQMAESILQLFNSKAEIQKLSNKGRETAIHFSWDHVKPKWAQLINNFKYD